MKNVKIFRKLLIFQINETSNFKFFKIFVSFLISPIIDMAEERETQKFNSFELMSRA